MKHSININKTAHYYTLGNLNKIQTIWFVLHGYGYSAEHFIKKFEPILNSKTLLIAPEGLSKFYIGGVDGKVGSSWMTKEDREDEIKDYVNYLNQLYEVLIKENPNAKINIVGFSQGGATACRWLSNGKIKCDNFILWCSVLPDDMQFKSIPKNMNTFILYGDNDKYVSDERITKQKKIIELSNIDYQLTKFKGKHDIPKEILMEQTKLNKW